MAIKPIINNIPSVSSSCSILPNPIPKKLLIYQQQANAMFPFGQNNSLPKIYLGTHNNSLSNSISIFNDRTLNKNSDNVFCSELLNCNAHQPLEYYLVSSSYGYAKNNSKKRLEDHNYKSKNYGDDSYFVRWDSLGVADGVGGWNRIKKANPLYYSMNLMHYSYEQISNLFSGHEPVINPHESDQTNSQGEVPTKQQGLSACNAYQKTIGTLYNNELNIRIFPKQILENSYEIVKRKARLNDIRGSTTACLAILQGRYLTITNLGDCGLVIIRNGKVIFKTEEQQHTFNLPYQLGTNSSDKASDAMSFNVEVKDEDVVVMGSDGLFDNLFEKDIVRIVTGAMLLNSCEARNLSHEKLTESVPSSNALNKHRADIITKSLATEALRMSKKGLETADVEKTPYYIKCIENGHKVCAIGKKDDITVLVAIISNINSGISTTEI